MDLQANFLGLYKFIQINLSSTLNDALLKHSGRSVADSTSML